MSAVKFLQQKGVFSGSDIVWIVTFGNGESFDICDLMDEFIKFESKGKEHNDKLLTFEYTIKQHPHISLTNNQL